MPRRGQFRFPPPKSGRRLLAAAPAKGPAAGAHLLSTDVELLIAYLPAHQAAKLAHLAGCAACQKLYRELLRPAAGPAAKRTDPREQAAELDRLAAAVRETVRRLEEGTEEAEDAVAELMLTKRDARPRRILHDARFRTPAVACCLFRRSLLAGSGLPEEAEALAALGLVVVGQLAAEGIPGTAVAELEVRGWSLIARSRWLLGDWPGVREAVDHVERLMVEQGYLRQHVGFRPAMRVLRLIERRLEDAVTVGARTLHELLGPLYGVTLLDRGSAPVAGTPEHPNEKEN